MDARDRNVPEDLKGGRPAVQKDRLTRLNQSRRRLTDLALLGGATGNGVHIGGFEAGSLSEDRTTVGSLEYPLLLELLEVSANRHLGDPQRLGQLRDTLPD